MANDTLLQIEPKKGLTQQEEVIDLRKLFFRMISSWYLFVIALVASLICAWFYNNYTLTKYRVTSTLLIEENKKNTALGTDQILQGFGLQPGMQNLDNQVQILTSWSLIGRALDSLPFRIEYYKRGRINKGPLYPFHPITVIEDHPEVLPYEIEFSLQYLGDQKFILQAQSENKVFSLNSESKFGQKIKLINGEISIDCDSLTWFENNPGIKLYFMAHSRQNLQENYKRRLKVEPATKEATIVKMTLEGNNKNMDIDFLNKLSEIFLIYNLDKKNKEANRTISFIDSQLSGISDSLTITEGNLQQFRSKHMVMNLSAQGQVIIDQAMKLENDRARLVIESNYYNYLSDYLTKDNKGEVPIAPATMGITDPGLARLVMELADLQGQYYSRSLGEKNPMQAQLALRLKNTKAALKETLNGVKQANELAMKENREQIATVNSKAKALPETEKNLLGIERKFKLNDVLYTFLLEKKSEAQIQKASNTPDNEVVDQARSDRAPIAPKTSLSYLIAILSGFGLPFLWLMLEDYINFKVRDEEDIKKITELPVAGYIPHSRTKSATVVFDEPHSITSEAFRSLRSRMQFIIKDNKSPVILVTSSMPAEGKTFTSINIASVYSLMGKKTVLVGFDLRKPKIYSDFGISNDKGVSTFLIGRDKLEDIINATKFENLSVITAGPVPPNPSELTSSTKTRELFSLLKERFNCIIIDSPPIGTVSDTFSLASVADACLMIVRQNQTLKHMLGGTLKDLQVSNISSVSLIVNDIGSVGKRYGYGSKYGYGYGYGYGYNYNQENGKKVK